MTSIHVKIAYDDGGEDREFVFDDSSLTSKEATQKESESGYVLGTIRGFHQRARQLADLHSEGWARDTRNEEKRGA